MKRGGRESHAPLPAHVRIMGRRAPLLNYLGGNQRRVKKRTADADRAALRHAGKIIPSNFAQVC